MTKNQILEALKSSCRPSIKLPSQLDMVITQNCLTISLLAETTLENMQRDSAAFEGWAIVVKRWIKKIDRVIIKWDDPTFSSISKNEMQHYQRFLFRAKRFSEAYSWLDIDTSNKDCFRQLAIDKGKEIILNTPSEERSREFKEKKELHTYSESQLEEFILSDKEACEQFKRTFDLKIVDNQLPVGVFEGKKNNETKIFTGGKSAIDIWGINSKGEFCLFELKNAKNSKVGALSEMLFYSFVIQDVINGVLKFDSTTYIGLKNIQEAKRVKCFLLAPSTHPLIDSEVFLLLNKSSSGIEYGNIKINDSLTFSIL